MGCSSKLEAGPAYFFAEWVHAQTAITYPISPPVLSSTAAWSPIPTDEAMVIEGEPSKPGLETGTEEVKQKARAR